MGKLICIALSPSKWHRDHELLTLAYTSGPNTLYCENHYVLKTLEHNISETYLCLITWQQRRKESIK